MEDAPPPPNGVVDVTSSPSGAKAPMPRRRVWPALVIVLLVTVLVLQITILSRVGRSNDDIAAVADAVAEVDDRLGDLEIGAARLAPAVHRCAERHGRGPGIRVG
jgi:hypothetical protein